MPGYQVFVSDCNRQHGSACVAQFYLYSQMWRPEKKLRGWSIGKPVSWPVVDLNASVCRCWVTQVH